MRRTALALILVLAPGCGGESPTSGEGPTTEEIRRVSTPAPEPVEDSTDLARLVPLTAEDLAGSGLSGPSCRFFVEGSLLLAASPADTIVRHQGDIRHLLAAAPIGPSGGFFEDRQLSASVGRTGDAGDAARLAITHRRSGAEREYRGVWTCRGRSGSVSVEGGNRGE